MGDRRGKRVELGKTHLAPWQKRPGILWAQNGQSRRQEPRASRLLGLCETGSEHRSEGLAGSRCGGEEDLLCPFYGLFFAPGSGVEAGPDPAGIPLLLVHYPARQIGQFILSQRQTNASSPLTETFSLRRMLLLPYCNKGGGGSRGLSSVAVQERRFHLKHAAAVLSEI